MLGNRTQTNVMEIKFEDLVFTVNGPFKSGTKTILNRISGCFYSGELTAILGASGSGKTTLLNVLAGYGPKTSKGSIQINGKSCEYRKFRKRSAYIMQDALLQPLLTVKEAMLVSAQLKLGGSSITEKLFVVDEIITVLGLKNCCDTMSENLSGGEAKRLAIALELVNNPSVIFLDEPTSGLDIVAMAQCLETLKVLTEQGRTVICSIHQPSASSFMQFDQVYFIAEGMCIYSGVPDNALSYLSSLGITCPTTYSPAEYIIELVQLNQKQVPNLVERCQNGKSDVWRRKHTTPIKTLKQIDTSSDVYCKTTETILDKGFASSFWTQYKVLYRRMVLQQSRNKIALAIQIAHHTLCGLIFGGLFYKIGKDASSTNVNFGFGISVMVFFVFTYSMVPILLFPTEVKLMKREYYNRWYGLSAYYLAMTSRSIPLMVLLGTLFMTIPYFMTNQPMDFQRYAAYIGGGLAIAFTSEAIGVTIGSMFKVTNGALAGPAILAPMLILSVYGIGYMYNQIILPIKIAMSLSYMRFGGSAIVLALLNNRDDFECTKIFCPYQDVDYFLRIVGMDDVTYTSRMLPLLGFAILFKILGYITLKCRLNPEVSYVFTNYIKRLIRR